MKPEANRALEGRVAIITGAGSGIGRATAMRFAREGAHVVVNDLDAAAAESTVASIIDDGGKASARPGDATSSELIDELVAQTVDELGQLDVMHNNVGYGLPGTLADLSDKHYEKVLSVTLHSAVYGTRAAVRVMRQRGGSIINTASNAAFGATSNRPTYSAAKAAVVNLTKSAAVEYGKYGIRVNAICPGPIETPAFKRFAPDLDYYAAQIPMKRLGRADDVAALALFLASDESSYISGVAISIDGAMMARLPEPYLTPDDVTA